MFDYAMMKKILFNLSPENAHYVAEFSSKTVQHTPFILAKIAEEFFIQDKRLEQQLLHGKTFSILWGLVQGLSKNATMIRMLTALGFGHIEYGAVTPLTAAYEA